MQFTHFAAATLAIATLGATPAGAQAPDDVSAIRRDMEQLRTDYEARIKDLEARLAKAEGAAPATDNALAASAPAPSPPADTTMILADQALSPASPAASGMTNPNIYNPGIAVALNGFVTAARKPTGGETIPGFAAGEDIGKPARGFSLGESEVSFTANIDPFLAGFFDFSLGSDSSASLEEAYIRTTALPGGISLKAGRFLSGIGYLNERHAHDWSFSDAPLPYRAFLNTQLGDDGVQARWIAPTDQYLEFGGEALRGESYPAAGAAKNGVGTYTAFARTGADLSPSSSYLAALSYLHTNAVDRVSGADLFSGDSNVGIASLIYKWAPGGNPISRNLTLAGEYFYGREKGELNTLALTQKHYGWYAQGVYQFKPRWSLGARIAGLNSQDAGGLFTGASIDDLGHNPMEYTGLVEFDTSEFGRLRAQYSRDETTRDANDIFTLQYTVIYGPHGAHRY